MSFNKAESNNISIYVSPSKFLTLDILPSRYTHFVAYYNLNTGIRYVIEKHKSYSLNSERRMLNFRIPDDKNIGHGLKKKIKMHGSLSFDENNTYIDGGALLIHQRQEGKSNKVKKTMEIRFVNSHDSLVEAYSTIKITDFNKKGNISFTKIIPLGINRNINLFDILDFLKCIPALLQNNGFEDGLLNEETIDLENNINELNNILAQVNLEQANNYLKEQSEVLQNEMKRPKKSTERTLKQ